MRRAALVLAVTAVLSIAVQGEEAKGKTLTGSYVWNSQSRPAELEAVFTAAGDRRWEVTFHFLFSGREHAFSGTAEGSLSDGALKGEVQNESKQRTFTFSGAFEDGTFHGTHAEIGSDGRASHTGTLTLGS